MAQLAGKKLLVIGGENKKISELNNILSELSVVVEFIEYEKVTKNTITKQKVDFIIVNYLQNNECCSNILDILNKQSLDKIIPVFALVDKNRKDIEKVLIQGATDYITEDENVDSVLQKIKAVLMDDNTFPDSSSIDITPVKADVTATGLKVFIVEDDPLLRNLLSIRMERSSFPFEFSSDGQDVVPVMKQFGPDAIILDLMLPGINGFEILAKIKEEPSLADIPVIVFSNRDGVDDRRKAEELGAVGFYVKAMTDLAELVEKIEETVSKK